jgi:hypothetical protein
MGWGTAVKEHQEGRREAGFEIPALFWLLRKLD